MAMGAIRQVACPDRLALARETNRFIGEAVASHPGRFVALAVGDSTLPLYAHPDELGSSRGGPGLPPGDQPLPPPARPHPPLSAPPAPAPPPPPPPPPGPP